MKILLINNSHQIFGGGDAVALVERQLLEDHGNEVVVYTRHNDEIKSYKVRDKLVFFLNTIYSLRTRREIRAIVRSSRPDVAYVHNVFPLISPSVYHTLHSLRIPLLHVVHDFRLWCPNAVFYTHGHICERCKYGNFINAPLYRCYRRSYLLSALYAASLSLNRLCGLMDKIDGFVCLTEFSKQQLLEVGVAEQKIFIKPNFVAAPVMHPAGKNKPNNYVLYIGRLSAEKGLWTLVRAFERLRDAVLKIVGTGPLEDPLKAYVRDRGLRNIEFCGFRQGQEKWELLKSSLFTVVPSEWYETFGLVVIEAYAAGKPVVGSRLGSLPWVIEENKSGLFFEPGNVDDLVNKAGYLLDRPDEVDRMGRYARSLFESTYSPDACYQKLIGIFASVCRKVEHR